MGKYSQADRAFRVDTPLGEDELLLESFTGFEQVSAPFQYTLEMLSENDSIDPPDLLGQPVSFSVRLADGSDRFFHGIVCRFRQLGKSEDLTSYQAEVVPWLWLLSLTRDCRIFQEKSVPDIIREIFSKYSNADIPDDILDRPVTGLPSLAAGKTSARQRLLGPIDSSSVPRSPFLVNAVTLRPSQGPSWLLWERATPGGSP